MSLATKSAGIRQLKNSSAKWLITLGGIGVLFTLVLIFLYLLYVIKPIFDSAKIEHLSTVSIETSSAILSTGVDELKEVTYVINEQGIIDFYQLLDSSTSSLGAKILSLPLMDEEHSVKLLINAGIYHKLLVAKNGQARLVKPSFASTYHDDIREIVPSMKYPLGQRYLYVDEKEQPINKLAFGIDDERVVFVGFTEDHRLIKTTLLAEDGFGDDAEYERFDQTTDYPFNKVDDILMSPDLALAFVRTGDQISVFSTDDEESFELKGYIRPELIKGAKLTSMALLSGGSSILLGDSNGQVSQWFEISTPNGRKFVQARTFAVSSNESVSNIYTEQFRKSFYTMTPSGEMGVFYATSHADLWRGKLNQSAPTTLSLAPRANGFVFINHDDNNDDNQATMFKIGRAHV